MKLAILRFLRWEVLRIIRYILGPKQEIEQQEPPNDAA
jgi:hypothetical protein